MALGLEDARVLRREEDASCAIPLLSYGVRDAACPISTG